MDTQKYLNINEVIRFNQKTQTCNEYGQYNGYWIDPYSTGKVEAYRDKCTKEVQDDIVKIDVKTGDKELLGKHVWVKISDCPKSSISEIY